MGPDHEGLCRQNKKDFGLNHKNSRDPCQVITASQYGRKLEGV